MDSLSFQVAEYDAPLDLILHLISKHKLDIVDIDISSLVDQYMVIIDSWQEKNLEVASEFLAMASRLVYMKTVSLLPRSQEESEQLRRDLSGQLMEYKICKLAAELLDKDNNFSNLYTRTPQAVDIDHTYSQHHLPAELYAALVDAIGRGDRRRPPSKDSFDPLVSTPIISVTSKIFTVLRTLREFEVITLSRLFDPAIGRSGLVATFLAVLELIKSGRIRLHEDTLTMPKSA